MAKGLLISTNIAAGYHEQDSIMLHQQPDLAYPLHHKANNIPYAAFVDDKLVQERGLRMVSHFDLLPYSDEKAMKLLPAQWKYHDPAGAYWTTVYECYILMTVGNVPRNVPATTTDVDPPPLYPSAARAQDCPTDSERGGLRFDGRQHNVERRLGAPPRKTLRVAQVVSSSHKNAQDNSLVDQTAPSAYLQRCINRSHDAGTVVDVDRTALAIYDDLHNCVGQSPSDSLLSTVVDSTYTWRSNVHERNKHSYLSEARVLEFTPSLKTVDSLFFTGETDQGVDRFDPTIMRSSRTSNSREQAAPKHALKSVPFAEQHSQTQRKRTEACTGSFDGPVIDLALVACGLSSTLLFSQNAASRSKCDIKSPLYQSRPLNVKYIVAIKSDLTSLHDTAHEMFLVRHSSMGEYASAKWFVDSQIDSLKPASKAASSGGFKILDQFYVHGCSSSEPGSGVVLAINDKD